MRLIPLLLFLLSWEVIQLMEKCILMIFHDLVNVFFMVDLLVLFLFMFNGAYHDLVFFFVFFYIGPAALPKQFTAFSNVLIYFPCDPSRREWSSKCFNGLLLRICAQPLCSNSLYLVHEIDIYDASKWIHISKN